MRLCNLSNDLFLAVVSLNCCVISPALILNVFQYACGVGRGKSLAFEAKPPLGGKNQRAKNKREIKIRRQKWEKNSGENV